MLSNIKIVLPVRQFNKYKKLMAEKAAIERQRKAILEDWEDSGFLPVKSAATVGEYVIVNGNNDEMGKVTVYHKDGFTVPAHYETRVS